MPTCFIHLAPNATKPTFSLTLTILFPTSFIPLSCWLMQKGFENLFNYCPVAKKTKYYERALQTLEDNLTKSK